MRVDVISSSSRNKLGTVVFDGGRLAGTGTGASLIASQRKRGKSDREIWDLFSAGWTNAYIETVPVQSEEKRIPIVRRVRTAAGVRKYGLPLGSEIVADEEHPALFEVPESARRDREIPGEMGDETRELIDQAAQNAAEFVSAIKRLPKSRWSDPDADGWKRVAEFASEYNLEADALHRLVNYDGKSRFDNPDDPVVLAEMVLQGHDNPWVGSYARAKLVRKEAHRLLGLTSEQTADLYAFDPDTEEEALRQGHDVGTEEDRQMWAYILLRGVLHGERTGDLFRSNRASSYDDTAELVEGAYIDLPIASFAETREHALRYGPDILFHIVGGSKGIRTGETARDREEFDINPFDEDFDEEEYAEWADQEDTGEGEILTGGRFRIKRVYTRQVAEGLPKMPDPLPDTDEEWYWGPDPSEEEIAAERSRWQEQVDAARPYYRRQGGSWVLKDHFEGEQTVIELEHVALFDPDTGALVDLERKDAGLKVLDPITYDWLFQDPQRPLKKGDRRATRPKRRQKKSFASLAYKAAVRRVRKPNHWVDPVTGRYLPIGAIIPPGAVLGSSRRGRALGPLDEAPAATSDTGPARGAASTPEAPEKPSAPRSGTAATAPRPKAPPKVGKGQAPASTITWESVKAPVVIYSREPLKPKWPTVVPDVSDEEAEMFPAIDRGDLARLADVAWSATLGYYVDDDKLHPKYRRQVPGSESVWTTYAEQWAIGRWVEKFKEKYGRDEGPAAWTHFAQRNRDRAIDAAIEPAMEWFAAHRRRSSTEKTDAPIPSYDGIPPRDLARIYLSIVREHKLGRAVFDTSEKVADRLDLAKGWDDAANRVWLEKFRSEYPGVLERYYADVALDQNFEDWKAIHKGGSSRVQKMTDDEIKDAMREELRKFAEDPETVLVIRRSRMSTLDDILRRGRFKTQFETKRSSGYLGPGTRSAFESQVFGYPTDLDPEKRPIYGYISHGLETDDTTASQYGGIRIVLKPSVKRRATMTIGDSLGLQDRAQPTPMTDPDWHAYQVGQYAGQLGSKPLFERDYLYPEVQVHGGLRAEDIERVDFTEQAATPTASVLAALRRLKIPYRVHGGSWQGGDPDKPLAELPRGTSEKERQHATRLAKMRSARRGLYPAGAPVPDLDTMTSDQLYYELLIVSAVAQLKRNKSETAAEFRKRKQALALEKLLFWQEGGDIPRPSKARTEEEAETERIRRRRSAAVRALGASLEEIARGLSDEEKAAIRRVRTPEGARQYGQPIGTIIRTDLPEIDWDADRSPAPDQPELFEVTKRVIDGRTPDSERIRLARMMYGIHVIKVRRSIENDDEAMDFYNGLSGVHIGDGEWSEYDEDDAEAVWTGMVASTGPWPNHFYTCRQIRKSAYEMLGFKGFDKGDKHIEATASGQMRFEVIDDGLADELAYTLLKGLTTEGGYSPRLYRGVDLHGDFFPAEIREGAILSLPLISTANDRGAVAQFGTDITFEIHAPRSVQGAHWSDTEDDEVDPREDIYEYVTGGQFEVIRVTKLREPTMDEITRNIGRMPEREDYEDEDDWINELDEWRDAFKREAADLGVEVDQDGDPIPWVGEKWQVDMRQVAVFDPDSGERIEVKAAGRRRFAVVPAIDWMFDGSLSNPDHPALETVDS